jgi:hypothetical protein
MAHAQGAMIIKEIGDPGCFVPQTGEKEDSALGYAMRVVLHECQIKRPAPRIDQELSLFPDRAAIVPPMSWHSFASRACG